MDRRQFMKGAALTSAAGAWFGGAHLLLSDDRWTPNRSYWVSRGRAPLSPPLRGAARADVAIVGAGVTGLSTAIHLLRRSPGLRVAVLEAQYAGYGATGRSGGVLGAGTEMGTPEGTADNVALVADLIDQFGIDCDFDREREWLDPYRYAAGLKRAAESLGAAVHEETRVLSIRRDAGVILSGEGFTLTADRMVAATNGYTSRLGIARSRLFPAHTGAAVTVPLPASILEALPDDILVMTSREMYMWGRKTPDKRLLVGAGASYEYGDGLYYDDDRFLFAALRRCVDRTWEKVVGYPFEHTWTGPMGCTTDQDPILGEEAPGVFYVGGYTGHGLAMGTRAGSFMAGWLDGQAPPAWLLRPTIGLPGEPFRYVGVNMVINLMNLGLMSMPKYG